jgi:hypothetical protein
MESTTLLACNKRYVVSARGDRIVARRATDALSLLKPDYLAHKGTITHIALHQPDSCFGTHDDWGRVVASSDVTHRVRVWLCDGEEEELMFARNMAEYVGYERVTALAWTADSKVAIGNRINPSRLTHRRRLWQLHCLQCPLRHLPLQQDCLQGDHSHCALALRPPSPRPRVRLSASLSNSIATWTAQFC